MVKPVDGSQTPGLDTASTAPEHATCTRCGHVGPAEGKGQCAQCKCWLGGNLARLTHGVKLFERRGELQPEIRQALNAFRDQLISDQGGEEELTAARAGLIDRLVSAQAVLVLLESDLAARGMLTPRGRLRTTYGAWLSALDRFQRLTKDLGLERRAVKVPTIEAYLAQKEQVRDAS